MAYGKRFKFLIPKEFGGGYVEDKYKDYGYLESDKGLCDMYELLALWNSPEKVEYDGDFNPMKTIDKYSDKNRIVGIDIGCYSEQIDKLKYPLKLVSVSCSKTYEEIAGPSYSDPDQGFFERKRD